MPRFDPRGPRSTRLVGVHLRNFKSVREANVTLGPLTVIAGANSAGKSSLLQAVLALAQVTRRRIDGDRFPLNDELARLGTFEAVRHQQADPLSRVRIGARFASDERDARMMSWPRVRPTAPSAGRRPGRESRPLEVLWVVELDGFIEDQLGSAQIGAIEVETHGEGFDASIRLERARTGSILARPDRPAESFAFTGTMRVGDSVTAVLDASISSGQIGPLFGTPPAPPVRVQDWFLALPDLGSQGLVWEEASQKVANERAIQQAVWAIRQEVPPDDEFLEWFDRLLDKDRESFEGKVLDAFQTELATRPRRSSGEAELLEGRGPQRLEGAQRACAQYLATRVRYVGPLRHAPHRPFPSAPDPDLGDVGVSGEYVASVLQANKTIEREYPVPEGGLERVALLGAVSRWLVFFGLAESLNVREDMPLVLGVDIVSPGLKRPVSLSAVGVGVSQVLPVVVQCLVAGPGALVALEQPELHLHPAAQQRLADFLLACMRWGQDLLVESHSEYLVLRLRRRVAEDRTGYIRDSLALIFASRDQDGVTVFRPVELTDTGAVIEWPDGFFDQGADEAHQMLIAAAERQRSAGRSDE